MRQIRQQLDPKSLQFRLTLGTTLVTVMGMGALSGWVSVRTEKILIGSHKQAVHEIADRVPQDIEAYAYRDQMTVKEGIQQAIDARSLPNLSLSLANGDGDVLLEPTGDWYDGTVMRTLVVQGNSAALPTVVPLNNRHYVVCAQPLTINGQSLGLLHIALDITDDREMFNQLIRTLTLVTLLAMGLMAMAIAFYVRRSLRSLRHLSQMTETLLVEDLAHRQLKLGNAPTEVRELAATCEKALTRLSGALNHQQQFVRDISHELRTPLSIVSGYLQSLLRRRHMFSEPQREALETAASEADHTIRLLQDLLNLERAESGHMQFNFSTVVLNDVIDDVVRMAITSSYRDIDLDIQVDYPVEAQVDPDSLRQVLAQLVDNALKYSEPDQSITVRLDHREKEISRHSSSGNDQVTSYAIIQVCDRGVGIPLQHQSRIFDQCYRVDSNRSRTTGGCGIGLSIVKVLVEGMGGTVSVRSKSDKGSIFTVTLPTSPNTYEHSNRNRGRRRKAGSVH